MMQNTQYILFNLKQNIKKVQIRPTPHIYHLASALL